MTGSASVESVSAVPQFPGPVVTRFLTPGAPGSVLQRLRTGGALTVIHSGRFGGATRILRAWSEELGDSGTTAHVLGPAAGTTEADYWAHLHASLTGGSVVGSGDDTSSDPDVLFTRVLDALATLTAPCTLLLDDVHLVADPVARVDALFAHAPAAGLRIVAATRSASHWKTGRLPRRGSTFISARELRYTADDIADLLGATRITFDRRSPAIIHAATDEVPGLVTGWTARASWTSPRPVGPPPPRSATPR